MKYFFVLLRYNVETYDKMNEKLTLAVVCVAFLVSCADIPVKRYALKSVEGRRIEVTSAFDDRISDDVRNMIEPYQVAVDSVMSPVLGESAVFMEASRPESLLSNWIADVLVSEADRIGSAVDMGLSNIGGMRSAMPKGNVTVGDVMAIAPFENRLCMLALNGADMLTLFQQIAGVGGEGVSKSVRMTMSEERELIDVTINGLPIKRDKTYRIATIDYLAEGNDGMNALKTAVEREDTKLLMRDMLKDYIKAQTAAGMKLDARIEGRIRISK